MKRWKKCHDCGEKVLADTQDSRPICEPCLDAFAARGFRSDPFWRHNDMALQRSVNAEMGDL
jgi:hypothetical protein